MKIVADQVVIGGLLLLPADIDIKLVLRSG